MCSIWSVQLLSVTEQSAISFFLLGWIPKPVRLSGIILFSFISTQFNSASLLSSLGLWALCCIFCRVSPSLQIFSPRASTDLLSGATVGVHKSKKSKQRIDPLTGLSWITCDLNDAFYAILCHVSMTWPPSRSTGIVIYTWRPGSPNGLRRVTCSILFSDVMARWLKISILNGAANVEQLEKYVRLWLVSGDFPAASRVGSGRSRLSRRSKVGVVHIPMVLIKFVRTSQFLVLRNWCSALFAEG